ncbi:MAG: hypothetical protein EU549_03385 [Promethearchaeota archaeon]|nr:MAG: hypothetical protein EU549_03385 [Candidatus Lokiarchaeota archaeon]
MSDIDINYKIWLEKSGENILGKGGAKLLRLIDETSDLGKASEQMGCSYKYAWTILRKIKERHENPVITQRGGRDGGGQTVLSPFGKRLLRLYNRFQEFIQSFLKNPELWESYGLKVDTKNMLKGTIEKIEKDQEVCKLKIKIDQKKLLKSIITTESVQDLELAKNKNVMILIKATEIQLKKE